MKGKIIPLLAFCLTVTMSLWMTGIFNFGFIDAEAATQNSGQTLSVSVNQTISLALATSTMAFGNLTPGVPVTATTSATVSTNSLTGWEFHANNDSGTSTMYLVADPSVGLPDYTAWDPTADGGNGNATTTPGATLSLRMMQTGTTPAGLYNTTWWGANDTDGTAKYAGFPTSATKIAEIASYQGSAQTVVYKSRLDVPATQRSGSYVGDVTLTALTKP